jgi:hypothetical protein
MSALIAYGSGQFVWFLIGASVVAAILFTVKKALYYVVLGRTSAIEKPGGGFADLEDLRNDFAGVQANSPKLYQEIIAPYLDSWKAKYGRRVPLHAVKVLEQRIANEMAVVKEKKQEIIAKAASEGKTIEISSLRKQLEESIADHQGRDYEQYVASIEHFLLSLQAKYGASIPVDEASKLADKLESDIRANGAKTN